jgi:hypothetical protein
MAALLAHESREYAAPSELPIPVLKRYNDFVGSTPMWVKPREHIQNQTERDVGMSLARIFIAWLCTVGSLGFLSAEPCLLAQADHQNSQDVLKTVLKAWSQRQRRFSTADISYKSSAVSS